LHILTYRGCCHLYFLGWWWVWYLHGQGIYCHQCCCI